MSDGEGFASIPPDGKLEDALRAAVQAAFRKGNYDELTVKRMRASVEKSLELPEDFFKTHGRWKDRSKAIIAEEVSAQEQGVEASPQSAKTSKPRGKVSKEATTEAKVPQKRKPSIVPKPSSKSQEPEVAQKPRKRRKVVEPSESEPEGSQDAESAKSPTSDANAIGKMEKQERRGKARRIASEESSDVEDGHDEPVGVREDATDKAELNAPDRQPEDGAQESESELSEVLDEAPPPKKKKQRERSSPPARAKSKSKSKAKPKAAQSKANLDLDPQEAEIKRLQGWLVKCGIRKLWHRELAKCDTSRAKINHLKGMLKDAGMDGRYSVEKARQIKEQRELQADLEAVQEGAKRWGQDSAEDKAGSGPPKRRLAKGLEELDFFGSDAGEETD